MKDCDKCSTLHTCDTCSEGKGLNSSKTCEPCSKEGCNKCLDDCSKCQECK